MHWLVTTRQLEENGGKNYGEQKYEVLMAKILEKFKCTTLFIPAEIRKDSEICQNEKTAKMIHEYLKYSSSAYSTNMWKSNFYTIPPCVYHTFTIERTVDGKGSFLFVALLSIQIICRKTNLTLY